MDDPGKGPRGREDSSTRDGTRAEYGFLELSSLAGLDRFHVSWQLLIGPRLKEPLLKFIHKPVNEGRSVLLALAQLLDDSIRHPSRYRACYDTWTGATYKAGSN